MHVKAVSQRAKHEWASFKSAELHRKHSVTAHCFQWPRFSVDINFLSDFSLPQIKWILNTLKGHKNRKESQALQDWCQQPFSIAI